MSDFRLKKWYLDCVTEEGDTFIGYCAELVWKSLNLTYASYLEYDGIHTRSQTSFLRERMPEYVEDGIVWNSDSLSCSGRWRKVGPQIPKRKLFENESGAVVWHAQLPLSEVNLKRNGRELTGLGYLEHLDLSVYPWQLPIDELHWGRFLTPNNSVVWIEWRGPHPLTAVYIDGKNVTEAVVSRSSVTWKGGSLLLCGSRVIREGSLANVLSKIPGAKKIFPEKILNTYEYKWLSSGTITLNGVSQTGWAIHEIVRFTKES